MVLHVVLREAQNKASKMKQTSKLTDWEKLHPNYAQDPKLFNEWQQILNNMIYEDSISKTIVYSSINHSAEIGVKISKTIKDSLIIMKKNMDMIIFTK